MKETSAMTKRNLCLELERLTERNAHGEAYALLAMWCKTHTQGDATPYGLILACIDAMNRLVDYTNTVIDAKLRYDMCVRLNQLIIDDFGGDFLDEINSYR